MEQAATQFSFPLPRSMDNRIYANLTVKAKSVLLLLTTAAADDAGTPTPMGSFVYAIPDVRKSHLLHHSSFPDARADAETQKFNPSQPLSTPLFTVEATLEFTSRLAKLLAKKTQLPVYVGNSMSLASTGLGGTMEEEMEAYKKVVEVVLPKVQDLVGMPNRA